MLSFYSIREDDLIKLLADHYELSALISGEIDECPEYTEIIEADLEEWRKTLKTDNLSYEKIAELNLNQYSRPLPERAKEISAIDPSFWKEEWA